MIRVLIADDEPLIRAGIKVILTSADDIDVVAEASNGREALELAPAHHVDVVLLDIQMPVMDGLTALPELRRAVPGAHVLILTTFGERENVLDALSGGSAGFLLKDSAPAELISAVRAAAAGDAYLSPGATRHVVDSLSTGAGRQPPGNRDARDAQGTQGVQGAGARGGASGAGKAHRLLATLSPRERDVLALLGEGLSNADTAQRLHMSEGTIKSYVSRILTKLNCDNRVQAALLARDAGLRAEQR